MGTAVNTYLLVTPKPWHDNLFASLQQQVPGNWVRIREKQELTEQNLEALDPVLVFIPHWSHIIPASVYNRFPCVVFHMTDLPYGRGGSPLQNLIANGKSETMVSAIRVAEGIDTGDVYLKSPLSLCGSAEEIFIRSAAVIGSMIREIIELQPVPRPQEGTVVQFRRRKPEESNLAGLQDIAAVYDHIRMLDCEGYPHAFIEVNGIRYEFSRAAIKADGTIVADVRISK